MFWIFFLIFLVGCDPVIFSGTVIGASVAGYEYLQLRNTKDIVINNYVASKVMQLLKRNKIDEPCIKILCVKGVPIIIGAFANFVELEKAKALMEQAYPKSECLANLQIGHWDGQFANLIRLRLTFHWDIAARNLSIYVIKNTVWVCGLARSSYEKDAIIKTIEFMDGVKSVKAHIVVDSSASGYVIHVG